MDWKYVIDRARDRHRLNQHQLAVRAGCTQAAISQLYRGEVGDPRYSIGTKLVELAGTQSDATGGTAAAPDPVSPDTGAAEDGQEM